MPLFLLLDASGIIPSLSIAKLNFYAAYEKNNILLNTFPTGIVIFTN